MEERITTLEEKVMYQEDLIQQLNQVVVGQQRAIDVLEKRVEQLARRLLEVEDGTKELPPSEKPPHY